MATYTGSGKWIKIDRGVISSGIDNHTCSSTSAATVTLNGKTYYGFVDTSTQCIDLPQLSRFTLSPGVGYTGSVKMYTEFTCPYQIILEEEDYSQVVANYRNYDFINGFMVG